MRLAGAKGNLALAATGALGALALLWWQLRRRARSRKSLQDVTTVSGKTSSSTLLRDRLTVILTTSPVGRHPCTDLLDEVIASFQLAEGLQELDLILVCDGYRSSDERGDAYAQSKFRSGIVDPTSASNYEAYKATLRARAAAQVSPALRVLELDSRHGFGFAVKAALDLVQTPYVIVVQHDRPFTRAVNIPRVLAAMERDPQRFKYVGMPTSTTCSHRLHVLSKYAIRIEPVPADDDGLEFMPLIQWYDSTHICLTEYYRNFVFGPRKLAVRGGFIEDKFGQAQLAAIRSQGVEKAHPEFGTFIASGDGFSEPCVGHLDGRDALNVRNFRFVGAAAGASAPVSWSAQAALAATGAMPGKRALGSSEARAAAAAQAAQVAASAASAAAAASSPASSSSRRGAQNGAAPPSPATKAKAFSLEGVDFLLDNSQLFAESPGLGYRRSKDLSDRSPDDSMAAWGTVVRGIDDGSGWLRVGSKYLPMSLGGCRVLQPKGGKGSNGSPQRHPAAPPQLSNLSPPPTSPPRLNLENGHAAANGSFQSWGKQTPTGACTAPAPARHREVRGIAPLTPGALYQSPAVIARASKEGRSLRSLSQDEPRKILLTDLTSPKVSSPCPEDGWEYVDQSGNVQGPFLAKEMIHWNSKGYFRADLLMRCQKKDAFAAFASLFPSPAVPFHSGPKRPATPAHTAPAR